MCVFIAGAGTAIAQDTVRRVTLSEALASFATHNLTLHLSKAEVEASAALARQATVYPNPKVSLSHEPLSDAGESYSESYFNLSQSFEWPGLRRARIGAARQLVRSLAARFQADSLALAFDVAEAFIHAATAEAHYQHVLQVTQVFSAANRSADVQYAEGEMSGYHRRRLSVEQVRYENRLARAELDLHRLQRQLALLILPEDDAVRIAPSAQLEAPPTPLALEAALERARTMRSELAGATAEVDAAAFALTRLKKELAPAPTLTAGYKRQSDGFDGLFLGTAFDLPVFDQKRGARDAQQAHLYQAETRRMLLERWIEKEVRDAHETYASLHTRTRFVTEDLMDEASALLHAAQVSYADGEMTLVELLDAADAFYDAQQTTISLTGDALIAYYKLMHSTGSIPVF